ncbi:class III extradiol ring-cleavage dioxygenase [Acidocella sp.]|uniref:DODA-type extradiol aromatic ring-opening family dioxygenase n=1 Tax=Acidocella sp. TaxID=50710 RepID=UPI00262482FD|nr:class III extradiol ring-cleavage dioxygenase [Acidocella sp.]
MTLPSLFVSHGSPMIALTPTPAHDFLAGLAASLPRPRAILVVSAHWETQAPALTAVAQNATIHDFFGFPRPLYQLRYPAPGDAALAQAIATRLAGAGFPATLDTARGLDHGAWVPLRLAWPEANIPVLQLSVQSHLGPAHAYEVGLALAPLRDEGVLIIGSGSFTHDLRRFRGQPVTAPESPDVTAFSAWMHDALTRADVPALLAYRRLAPFAADEHPTEEHLLPLFTALGAGGPIARRLHSSTEHAILRMDAYGFGLPAGAA